MRRRLALLLLLLLSLPWVVPSVMEGQPSTLRAKQLIITDGQGAVLRMPRMTTAQRDATSHQNGEIIYCTNCSPAGIYSYHGGSWTLVSPVSGGVLNVGEVDGSPYHAAVGVLVFDQADGFVLSGHAGGGSRLDLSAVPDAVIAALAASKLTGQVSATQGGTGLDTSSSTGTARADSGTWTVANLKAEGYTTAGLPAAGTAGRIVRVTDGARGLWVDNGTAWIKLYPYVDLKDFAVGDATTDDTAGVQAWLSAVVDTRRGGFVNSGRYKLTAQVSATLAGDQPFVIMGTNRGSGSAFGSEFLLGANLADNDTAMVLIDAASQESAITVEGVGFAGAGNTGTGLKIQNMGGRTTVSRSWFNGFLGRGLWTYVGIGINLVGVHAEGNGTGWENGGVTSIGEGIVTGSKFTQNTVRNVYLNTGSSFFTFIGNTIYGAASTAGVQLANGVFAVGFYQTNFESASPGIYVASGHAASFVTVEGSTFNPSAANGETKYAIDIHGELVTSRIQGNSVNAQPAAGGTVIGIRVGASTNNVIGPNSFSKDGAGTLTNYSLPNYPVSAYGFDADGATKALLTLDAPTHVAALMSGANMILADNTIQSLRAYTAGMLVVRRGGHGAVFIVSNGAVTEISDPGGTFTTTKDTASSLNVYWGAGGTVDIQNTIGSAQNVNVVFVGQI